MQDPHLFRIYLLSEKPVCTEAIAGFISGLPSLWVLYPIPTSSSAKRVIYLFKPWAGQVAWTRLASSDITGVQPRGGASTKALVAGWAQDAERDHWKPSACKTITRQALDLLLPALSRLDASITHSAHQSQVHFLQVWSSAGGNRWFSSTSSWPKGII